MNVSKRIFQNEFENKIKIQILKRKEKKRNLDSIHLGKGSIFYSFFCSQIFGNKLNFAVSFFMVLRVCRHSSFIRFRCFNKTIFHKIFREYISLLAKNNKNKTIENTCWISFLFYSQRRGSTPLKIYTRCWSNFKVFNLKDFGFRRFPISFRYLGNLFWT